MGRPRFAGKCCLVGIVLLLHLPPAPQVFAQADALPRVLRAWEARSALIRSGEFSWTETISVAPQSQLTRPETGPARFGPDSPVTVSRKIEVAFADDKLRYVSQGSVWDSKLGEFVERTYISTHDGQLATAWYDHSSRPSDSYLTRRGGFLSNASRSSDADLGRLYPVLHQYRATSPEFGQIDPQKCAIVGSAPLGQSHCLILQTAPIASVERRYWLDPDKDYAILRIEGSVGKTRRQIYSFDLELAYDAAVGVWVPKSWKSVSINSMTGRVGEETAAMVDSYQLNKPIAPTMFQASFPPGTVVTDRTHDKIKMSITTNNGGSRSIHPIELAGRTYDEIVADKAPRRLHLWAAACAVVALLVVIVRYVRYRR